MLTGLSAPLRSDDSCSVIPKDKRDKPKGKISRLQNQNSVLLYCAIRNHAAQEAGEDGCFVRTHLCRTPTLQDLILHPHPEDELNLTLSENRL